MPKGYHHLTYEERCQIQVLIKRGDSISTIAKELNFHRSTISREIKRNSGQRGYHYQSANKKAIQRKLIVLQKNKKMKDELKNLVTAKLELGWSPEQVSGRLKREGAFISHETIYKHIWEDKKKGGFLYKNLRHQGKKYNKRGKSKAGRGYIPNRVDIDERPEVVKEKIRVGDWELDTIIGAGQSGAIVSIVDRASKYTMLKKVAHKKAEDVEAALIDRLTPFKNYVHTLTADNGKEFSRHERVSLELEANFYFAKPYHSWERGLNEHTNGLVRQYFPKSKRFDEISEEDLKNVEIILNNRPRKVLEFETPLEFIWRKTNEFIDVALQA